MIPTILYYFLVGPEGGYKKRDDGQISADDEITLIWTPDGFNHVMVNSKESLFSMFIDKKEVIKTVYKRIASLCVC